MSTCIYLKFSADYSVVYFCLSIIFKFHVNCLLIIQSGGEASIVAEVVEVEENSTTNKMQTLRIPPVLTVNKSAAYAMYQLTYIRVWEIFC